MKNDIIVMGSEPIPDMTPDDIRAWYLQNHNEDGLAVVYAASHNKAWWVEDNKYDFEKGTPEHTEACAISLSWFMVTEELEQEILAILRSEGVKIPSKGRIAVLSPFMERHGFIDGRGWWIKKSK